MKKNIYETKDFYHGSLLLCMGLKLSHLVKRKGNFTTFVFIDKNQSAKKLIQRYWNRELKVDARALIDSINELKTRMYGNE